MTTISEAITTIKKAENDAEKLIEDSKLKSSEMIEEAKVKSSDMVNSSKNSAHEEAKEIIFNAEEKAKKEAISMTATSESDVEKIKNEAMVNVDEAASLIVKNIL